MQGISFNTDSILGIFRESEFFGKDLNIRGIGATKYNAAQAGE